MKATLRSVLTAAVVLALAAITVSAQTPKPDPGTGETPGGEPNGTPDSDTKTNPHRDGIVVTPPAPDSGFGPVPTDPSSGVERPRLPERILERLREFERVREAYLANQLQLIRQLRNASEEDREKLREMIQAQRQDWLDQAQAIRDRARERLQEILEQLPQHREAIEAAREQARETLQEAKDAARERQRSGLD